MVITVHPNFDLCVLLVCMFQRKVPDTIFTIVVMETRLGCCGNDEIRLCIRL